LEIAQQDKNTMSNGCPLATPASFLGQDCGSSKMRQQNPASELEPASDRAPVAVRGFVVSGFLLFYFLMELVFEFCTSALAKQALYHLSHTSSPFCSGYFGDGVSQTICLDWP
jgi:hypothetical protein